MNNNTFFIGNTKPKAQDLIQTPKLSGWMYGQYCCENPNIFNI